jgi:hypothetical protein
VPPYQQDFDAGGPKGVDDFKVWVDGRSVAYQVDSKAILNGVDYSGLLRKLGVDVASFGQFTDTDSKRGPYSPEIEKLPRSQRDELARIGLVRREDGFPEWSAVKMYHWQQVFPAGKTLHVRHEYTPIAGFALLAPEVTFPIPKAERTAEFATAIRESCIDAPLQKTLTLSARNGSQSGGYIETIWIDYILTTANTWKTPIKNFELIVERPKPTGKWYAPVRRWLVSLCWDGPMGQLDADHFVARAANFVPKKELHVAFFGVN